MDLGVFARRQFLPLDECADLRAQSASEAGRRAEVVRAGASTVDEHFRRGTTVDLAGGRSSIQERLRALTPQLEAHFQARLSGCDPPKLLVYHRGDFFKPHRDRGHDDRVAAIARRQVSVVMFLEGQGDDGGAYGGGELLLYRLRARHAPQGLDGLPARVEPAAGLLIAFPADVFHEVTPVRWGERHTLVSWFY